VPAEEFHTTAFDSLKGKIEIVGDIISPIVPPKIGSSQVILLDTHVPGGWSRTQAAYRVTLLASCAKQNKTGNWPLLQLRFGNWRFCITTAASGRQRY
jgi:hypothetical protein